MTSPIKKVVIVGPLPPPAGGMANQTRQLATFLTNENIDVDIVQVNASYRPAWIGKLPILRAGFRLLQYKSALKNQLKDADIVHIMANSGWSWHLFAAPAIKVAKTFNKPVILNYRGGYADEFFKKSWHYVKRTIDLVDEIVVPSPFLQEVFDGYGKIAVIVPNVLNQQRFNTLERTAARKPTVIVTRNLEAIYDVGTAIKIFANIRHQYPEAELKIAGTGPELASLTALAASEGVASHVNFLGRLAPEQMAELYKSADLMLNTSLVDNSPNSIIEALACGTPCVSTNVGGIPKLVNHEHDALLAEAKDVNALTVYALAVLNQEKMRASLISNGLATAKKFYWQNVWEQLRQCYEKAQKG
ncbi:glycosyltransferase family 4 protein [Thalassotalea atypica]|uniref:glycosyltransferase family 4 protein n=1 Tax=Thalassotalea atypica TaxID=2054316 RepID=UPI002573B162|nr:glycosyltransferase family 4 protein [Thalassotalea atypica]